MAGDSKNAGQGERARLKRFLLRLSMYGLVFLAVRLSIEAVVPYHMGNEFFQRKLKVIREQGLKPEILFFGTSRVQGGVDPVSFDSTLARTSPYDGVSFNLGIYSAITLESIHLARNFLKSETADSSRTFFIELELGTQLNRGVNKDKERSFYWLNPSNSIVILRGILSQNGLSFGEKMNRLSGLASALSNRCLGLGRFRTFLLQEENIYLQPLDSQVRGYMPVDEEEARYGWEHLKIFRERFDTSKIRRQKSRMESERLQTPVPQSPAWAGYLNAFIEEASRSGVRVVYLSMPPYRDGLESYVAENLKPGHYLNLADPAEYPELFEPSIYYDQVHLSSKGVVTLTDRLAKAYLALEGGSRDTLNHPVQIRKAQ